MTVESVLTSWAKERLGGSRSTFEERRSITTLKLNSHALFSFSSERLSVLLVTVCEAKIVANQVYSLFPHFIIFQFWKEVDLTSPYLRLLHLNVEMKYIIKRFRGDQLRTFLEVRIFMIFH